MSLKRILLCRLGGIGDVVQTLPFVKYLRKIHKEASIEYLTSENISELLVNCCPYIDKVWIYRKEDPGFQVLPVDYFFNLHGSLSFFFFNLFYIRARKFFQYRKKKNIHAALNFARVYDPNLSFFDLSSRTLYVKDPTLLLEKYQLKKDNYVCFIIGVGSKRLNRSWRPENWILLAKEFLNLKKDFKIVFLGGEEEAKNFEDLLKSLILKEDKKEQNRINNLLGKLTLSENAQIISSSEVLVSCDTGLLHLASALGKKVVGLYGPTTPERTGPFTTNNTNSRVLFADNCQCVGLFRENKKCRKNNMPWGYCMDSLKVESVLQEIFYLNSSFETPDSMLTKSGIINLL